MQPGTKVVDADSDEIFQVVSVYDFTEELMRMVRMLDIGYPLRSPCLWLICNAPSTE